VRQARDQARVAEALSFLQAAASDQNGAGSVRLMPLIIAAVRARASVGEISDVLASAWGVYNPAM